MPGREEKVLTQIKASSVTRFFALIWVNGIAVTPDFRTPGGCWPFQLRECGSPALSLSSSYQRSAIGVAGFQLRFAGGDVVAGQRHGVQRLG